jgi:hypothetical protein
MTFITPRLHQGQIVEVSYAWDAGDLLRRTHDRNDASVVTVRLAGVDERDQLLRDTGFNLRNLQHFSSQLFQSYL